MTPGPQRHRHRPRAGGNSAPPAPDDGESVALDILRGDLYRMLDEIARARGESHRTLVLEFESAWQRYKQVTGGRAEGGRQG